MDGSLLSMNRSLLCTKRIVLDLPTDAGETMGSSRYLYYQSAHSQGIPYGPDARASASLLRELAISLLCRRRADEHQRLGLSQAGQHGVSVQQLEPKGRVDCPAPHLDPPVTTTLQHYLESQLALGTLPDQLQYGRYHVHQQMTS